MSSDKCRQIRFNVFPAVSSALFEQFWVGFLTFWATGDRRSVDAMVARSMSMEGWEVVSEDSRGFVRPGMFGPNDERRRYVEEALTGKIHVDARCVRREIVEAHEDEGEWLRFTAQEYQHFVTMAKADAYAFWHRSEPGRWGTGVTDDGNEYLPLWTSPSDATIWAAHWSDHELVVIPRALLAGSDDLLEATDALEMAVGLGIGSAIVMHHPVSLRRDLLSKG